MLPYLHLGPLTLPTPGIILLLGLWLGLSLAEKSSDKRGIEPNFLYTLVFTSIIFGLVTARLAYVVPYLSSFLSDPIAIILPNLNTLDVNAGLAGAGLAALVYANRKNLGLWQTLDALAPVFAILAISLPLANLASGNSYGSPTDVPWGINLWGAKRHPVQIYELLGAGFILLILWPSKPWIDRLKPGGLFLIFVAMISLNVLVFEAFRGNSGLVLQQFRILQVISLAFLIISLQVLRQKLPISPSEHR